MLLSNVSPRTVGSNRIWPLTGTKSPHVCTTSGETRHFSPYLLLPCYRSMHDTGETAQLKRKCIKFPYSYSLHCQVYRYCHWFLTTGRLLTR